MPLVTSTDIVGSGTQSPSAADGTTLTMRLADAGATALANWSRVHVGDALALVVDGVVVAVPTINEPIAGDLTITFVSEPLPVPIEALEAMLVSGPLPPEWAQPERPQG